jgi:hypothetical protein
MSTSAKRDSAALHRETVDFIDQTCLHDLIAVLELHPRGLRRWSVMRAMRERAQKSNREVSCKFEDKVERVFRHFCEGDILCTRPVDPSKQELFFRPKDTAGEVWAMRVSRRPWIELS